MTTGMRCIKFQQNKYTTQGSSLMSNQWVLCSAEEFSVFFPPTVSLFVSLSLCVQSFCLKLLILTTLGQTEMTVGIDIHSHHGMIHNGFGDPVTIHQTPTASLTKPLVQDEDSENWARSLLKYCWYTWSPEDEYWLFLKQIFRGSSLCQDLSTEDTGEHWKEVRC